MTDTVSTDSFFDRVLATVKLREIEERYDLYFSRPLGYLLAKGFAAVRATPTQVSVLSMITGIGSAVAFYFLANPVWAVTGCLLLTLAGLLDSADGQLARMTGQSTALGRVIDGIVDNVVFIACYLGGGFSAFQDGLFWDWYIFGIGVLAGAGQSYKQGIYEYLKSEYYYYVSGDARSRLERSDEIRSGFDRSTPMRRFIYAVYVDYARKQETISFRGIAVRDVFEKAAFDPARREAFVAAYRAANHRMLFWWAWICGTNTHRGVLMLCALAGHFDWFFYFGIITILPAIGAGLVQQRRDRRLMEAFPA